MLNTRRDVARAVAAELLPLEAAIDGAIVHGAKLQIAIVEGRQRAKLPLDAAQGALDKILAAQAQMIAARSALHEAHSDLRVIRDNMGVRADYGDYGDSPTGYALPDQPALTVVSAEAA